MCNHFRNTLTMSCLLSFPVMDFFFGPLLRLVLVPLSILSHGYPRQQTTPTAVKMEARRENLDACRRSRTWLNDAVQSAGPFVGNG